jgi:hypothetical protein
MGLLTGLDAVLQHGMFNLKSYCGSSRRTVFTF